MSMVLHMMRIIVMAKKDPCTERMEENFITMDGLHWLHLAQAEKNLAKPSSGSRTQENVRLALILNFIQIADRFPLKI
jgi:hypothetical protein